MKLSRIQTLLATLWAGMVLTVGGLAAPALFSVLERQAAGLGAGRMFSIEARVSFVFAVLIFLLERRRVRDAVEAGQSASAVSATLLLALSALFLTIMGEFVLHPLIEAAKAGQATTLSFGALHGISSSLYWLKALLIGVLAWRQTQ